MPDKMKTKPPFSPTQAQRKLVELHATVGTPQKIIAELLGIDPKTLRKYFRRELDVSKAKANATIGGKLFEKAKGGDTVAQIFWMKTQAGWRETKNLDHSSSDGTMSPSVITRRVVDPKEGDGE